MSPTRTCPRCQTTYSAEVVDAQVGGVCPRCLFQLILGETGEITVKAPSAEAPALDIPPVMGNYEIIGMVGSGGMGKVYKARQRGLDRFVAIKVLGGAGQEEVERFFREARASAKLRHPNIIPIHEVVNHAGRYFYAMDFVEGKTLDRAVQDGELPMRRGLEILAKAARAIHFAHEHGVIHRDIKPANILLDGRGEPMVADFGLAKDISSEAGLTQSGFLLGTPSYMAPEQAEPDRKGEVDAQSDVYSLGATLYFILAGRPPHEGRSVYEVIAKVVGDDPAAPRSAKPEIPRDVETICLKALRRDRASRYATAKELADDLDRYLGGEPILARPIGFVESLALKGRRHRRPILAGAATALVVLASILLYQRSRPAFLHLVTQPPGATVEINGRRLEGVTPFVGLSVSAGRIEVTARRSGYRVESRSFEVRPGARYPLELPLSRSVGRLNFQSLPEGCELSLVSTDRESREFSSPVNQELPTGTWRFRLSKENYVDQEGSFTVQENGEAALLCTLEPRLLVELRTPERSIRRLVIEAQSQEWCVSTDGDRYRWGAGFPAQMQPGKSLPAGIEELLLMLPKGRALWNRNDGAVEATGNYSYHTQDIRWTYRLGTGRVASIVPVLPEGSSHRLLFVGAPTEGPGRSTPLHLLSAPDGAVIWKSLAEGRRHEARTVTDVDGDGRDDLLIWGDGASILSGATGKELLAVAGASRKILAAGVSGGKPRSVVFAASDGCSGLELPGGARRWETKIPSGSYGSASALVVPERVDLLVLRDQEIQRNDGATGRVVWSRTDVRPRVSEPHAIQDADLDGIGDLIFRETERLVCISGADGRTLWKYHFPRLSSSRLIALGTVDLGGIGGRIAAAFYTGEFMELTSATQIEGREIPTKKSWLFGRCIAVEAPNGGYPDLIMAEDGRVRRCSAETGREAWTIQVGGEIQELRRMEGTGTLLALSNAKAGTRIQALSEVAGRLLWEVTLEGSEPKTLAFPPGSAPPRILLATMSADKIVTLICRDAVTGRETWARTLPGELGSLTIGGKSPWPVGLTMVDRPFEPGIPDLNGRCHLLSAQDGKTSKILSLCWRGARTASCLEDVNGDGVADLLLVSEFCAAAVNGASGGIMWARYLRFMAGDSRIQVREGHQAKELIIPGVHTYALRARDGTLLREVPGHLLGYSGNRWVTNGQYGSRMASQIDPETFMVTAESYDRGIYRSYQAEDPLILSGDRLYMLRFGKGLANGLGRVHLLPLSFQKPGVTVARLHGAEGAVELPLSQVGMDKVHKEFPNTPQGSVEAFLTGMRERNGDLLRKGTILEGGTDWPSAAVVDTMEKEARSGLVEWLLDWPDLMRFGSAFNATVKGVEVTGEEATVSLDRKVGNFWQTFRVRRVDGSWKIVLRLRAQDLRTMFERDTRHDVPREVFAALKSICTAQAALKAGNPGKDGISAYWTGDLAGLHHQGQAKLIDLAIAQADPAPLPRWPLPPGGKPVPYHGYFIRAIPLDPAGKPYALDLNGDGLAARNQLRFAFCAYPANNAAWGHRSLIVSEGGVIFSSFGNEGKPVGRFPTVPNLEGWNEQR